MPPSLNHNLKATPTGRRLACRARLWLAGFALTWIVTGCTQLPASAKQQLVKAEREYRANDYRAAAATLDELLKWFPQYSESAEGFYLRALCRVKLSSRGAAEQDARRCIELSGERSLRARCHATLAELLLERGDAGQAVGHFAQAMEGLGDDEASDAVGYHYGVCLARLGDWKAARQQLSAVAARSRGAWSAAARQMNNWPRDYFTIQCGIFRNEEGAKEHVRQLAKAGVEARVEKRVRSGETLYMACTGQYTRYGAAQDALRSLQGKVKGAVIVP